MAGNFIQGAMNNALSIQTNPAGHMANSQRAFASGGDVALKLTALIDQEEKMRTDKMNALNEQILQGEKQLETNRSNLASEGIMNERTGIMQQNAETSRKNYELSQEKFDYEQDVALGSVNAPTLSTTTQDTVGNAQDKELVLNVKDNLQEEFRTTQDPNRKKEIIGELKGVLGSAEGLAIKKPERLQTIAELNTGAKLAFDNIDKSAMSDGEKVGLKLELKQQVEDAKATIDAQIKRSQALADKVFLANHKENIKTTKASKQDQKDNVQNAGVFMANNVVDPKTQTKKQYDQQVNQSVQNLDSNGLSSYPRLTKTEQNKYLNSFTYQAKNSKTSGMDTNTFIQWAAVILGEKDMDATNLKTILGKGISGKYSHQIKIANTLANPETTQSERLTYSKRYENQEGDLEETWDTLKQAGGFDDLISLTGLGTDTVTEATFNDVIDWERNTIGSDYMSTNSKYVPDITDSVGQRDTIDTKRVTKSLLDVFGVKNLTKDQTKKIEDYERFVELSYDLKAGVQEKDQSAYGQMFNVDDFAKNELAEIVKNNPDFMVQDERGNPVMKPIINVVKDVVGLKTPINATNKYKEIAHAGGPRTRQERDFFGYMFMLQVADKAKEDTPTDTVLKPIMNAANAAADAYTGN